MDHQNPQIKNLNPFQNLRGFATSRPPLIIFLLCLTAFAVIAMSFAYFVRRSELKNPDVTLDWNVVLENFSNLEICVSHKGASGKPVAAIARDVSSVINQRNNSLALDDYASSLDSTPVSSYRFSENDIHWEEDMLPTNQSVSVGVMLHFSHEIQSLPTNISTVTGFVCGHQLGIKGAAANKEFEVSFQLPAVRNFSKCDREKGCEPSFLVCMTFHGLPILPATNKLGKCVLQNGGTQPSNFTTSPCPDQVSHKDDLEATLCHGTSLRLVYVNNPKLSVMLSEHDRTIINLHLLYSSYFLLVMVMTLLCYAIICGRPKSKPILPEEVPFIKDS